MPTSNSKHRLTDMCFCLGLACGLVPFAALAHHVMDGAMPATLAEGLLSGLGHPIIGLDHFLFVLALGVLCWHMNVGLRAIGSFLGASLFGIALHLSLIGIPGNESLVALSLLAAGISLWSGKSGSRRSLIVPAAIAGIFHGYAFGESIVGAETAVLMSYLFGLVVVQSLVGTAAYWAAKAIARRYAFRKNYSKWIGALVSCFGAGFFLLSLV